MSLKRIFHPAAYHGRGKVGPFFEGWYFKVVDAHQKTSLAIIPGIFLSPTPEGGYSFIQVLDAQSQKGFFFKYRPDQFRAETERFDIAIGNNRFSEKGLSLNIKGKTLSLSGTLSFENPCPWPVTATSPGVMGWYAWMPFMQCYHGIVSMDHSIRGSLQCNGREVDFTGGRGYTEKDWGRAFPESWLWIQCNHFEEPGTSLFFSLAHIPWLGKSFPGFIAGFLYKGTLFRFATYTGAKVRTKLLDRDQVHLIVEDSRHILEMAINRPPGIRLLAPSQSGLNRPISESLSATVETALYHKKGRLSNLIFSGIGEMGGLETVGDLKGILNLE